jgi:probable addiction module antidote protein
MARDRTLTPFDLADYLKSEDDMAGFLAAALETGEPDDVTNALAIIARARGMTEVSREAGLARGTLYKAVAVGANPTLSTLLSLVKALGLTLSARPADPVDGHA